MNCFRAFRCHFDSLQLQALLALILSLSLFAGCDPAKQETENEQTIQEVKVSEVPLRVWVIADLERVDLFKRQWQAGSDQPIDITPMTIPSLLELQTCNCDILIYPSRLLGEIQGRGWLSELPKALQTARTQPDNWTPFDALPQPYREQAEYDGFPYALPLGQTSCVVLRDSSQTNEEGEQVADSGQSWQQIFAALTEEASNDDAGDDVDADTDAVVDRFLAIATSLSERDAKYGLLFELRPFASRLTAEEFVQAAQMLKAMQRQPQGRVLTQASHQEVWGSASRPSLVAIASASTITSQPQAAKELLDVAEVAPPIRLNTGRGLNASVATSCRQTAQTVEFIKWLSSPSTRAALSSVLSGINTNQSSSDPRTIDAQRIVRQAFASRRRCLEPRLPGVEQYRSALGEQLLQILSGEKEATAALTDANSEWQRITTELGKEKQLTEYRKSLGLTQ